MAVRQIATQIALDGEQEFKRQMSEVNRNFRNLDSEMKLVESTFKGQANTVEALTEKSRILRETQEQQEEKVRALREALEDASKAYGDADKRTDGFRQSLNRAQAELIDLNRDLQDTDRYLEEAARSANGTASSIDGFGKKLEGSSGRLSGFVSGLSTLKNAVVGGAVVTGLKEIGEAVFEIVDGTEEYRRIMGTLEVSSEAAGYTAQQTAEVYNRLYSVLGDTQAAATATANLQAIGLGQEALMHMTNLAIGAWASYGDSIPIDQMAEAINMASQQSEVSSGLADALDWAGVSQEAFKAKLDAANSSAERANIVMDALAKQGLAETADAWFEVNDTIVKSNEAQAKWDEQMAKLGETLSPAKDALINFGADAIGFVNGLLENSIELIQDLMKAASDLSKEMGTGVDARGEGRSRTGSGKIDGSHASGLDRVPYDGYVAELHKDEAVLTKEEAAVWHALSAGPPAASQGVTAQELQQVTAAAVNAINLQGSGGGVKTIVLQMNVNGKEFYRETIEDFRDVNRENPEVTDDR